MSMDAPTMDVLRKQAIAMAMLWFTARDYQTEGGHAWFHIRARDLGLREDVLTGMKITVRIECELDGAAGVPVDAPSEPNKLDPRTNPDHARLFPELYNWGADGVQP